MPIPLLSTLLLLSGCHQASAKADELHVGSVAPAFTSTDAHGKSVHFPSDFKGKLVLLDFWATYCAPCLAEGPNVAKVYKQLGPKGFEVLGINEDDKLLLNEVAPKAKRHSMTWRYVLDGVDLVVAKAYHIDPLPQLYLVNGNTGVIVAEGDAVMGKNLLPTVQKALAAL